MTLDASSVCVSAVRGLHSTIRLARNILQGSSHCFQGVDSDVSLPLLPVECVALNEESLSLHWVHFPRWMSIGVIRHGGANLVPTIW